MKKIATIALIAILCSYSPSIKSMATEVNTIRAIANALLTKTRRTIIFTHNNQPDTINHTIMRAIRRAHEDGFICTAESFHDRVEIHSTSPYQTHVYAVTASLIAGYACAAAYCLNFALGTQHPQQYM